MTPRLTPAAAAISVALMLSACVSERTYEQTQQLHQVQAQSAAERAQIASEQAQIAKMQQENKWVVAGDMLFPEGGYQLSPSGQSGA
jgi:chemotaxis protein MotB